MCWIVNQIKLKIKLKIELLHSKHNLRESICQAVCLHLFCLTSRTLSTACNQKIFSMLGYIFIIAKLTNLHADVKSYFYLLFQYLWASQMYLLPYFQYLKLLYPGIFQQKYTFQQVFYCCTTSNRYYSNRVNFNISLY